jgi:16S rRNA processing protein RimM
MTEAAMADSSGSPGLPSWPADAVEVGRILGGWGVKGWLKVQPFSGDPKALTSSVHWYSPSAAAREVADRDEADRLTGSRVFVSRSQFPAAAEGEYYWVDLIGLDVFNRDGQCLGRVTGLIETGVHDVLKLVETGGDAPRERLIPFVPAYIDEVDLPQRRIAVDWGLDY